MGEHVAVAASGGVADVAGVLGVVEQANQYYLPSHRLSGSPQEAGSFDRREAGRAWTGFPEVAAGGRSPCLLAVG